MLVTVSYVVWRCRHPKTRVAKGDDTERPVYRGDDTGGEIKMIDNERQIGNSKFSEDRTGFGM